MPLKTLGPIGPRAVGERVKPKGQKQLRQLMWRILNAENQILKYIQIFAAGKNQADLRNPCFC